jgi:hypothetical protein
MLNLSPPRAGPSSVPRGVSSHENHDLLTRTLRRRPGGLRHHHGGTHRQRCPYRGRNWRGPAIGSVSGNAGKGALIGAGAGALGGYLYDQDKKKQEQNYYYDQNGNRRTQYYQQ